MSDALMERSMSTVKNNTALGRIGYPKEISRATLFVASDNTASFITGESITIDGGMY